MPLSTIALVNPTATAVDFPNTNGDVVNFTVTNTGADIVVAFPCQHYLVGNTNVINTVTSSPSVTWYRENPAFDAPGGINGLAHVELWRAKNVAAGAYAITFATTYLDNSSHVSAWVTEMTNATSDAPTVAVHHTAYDGSVATYASGSTGTLPQAGGMALSFLGIRISGADYTVGAVPTGFTAVAQDLSCTSTEGIAVAKKVISATTALNTTWTTTANAAAGACSMVVHYQATSTGLALTSNSTIPVASGVTSILSSPSFFTASSVGATQTLTITDQDGTVLPTYPTAVSTNTAAATVTTPASSAGQVTVTSVALGIASINISYTDPDGLVFTTAVPFAYRDTAGAPSPAPAPAPSPAPSPTVAPVARVLPGRNKPILSTSGTGWS